MRVTFRINYYTSLEEQVCLIGSNEAIGNWDTTDCFPMYYCGNGEWEALLELENDDCFEYKYLIKNKKSGILWEGGKNRTLSLENFPIIEIRDYWRQQVDPNSVFTTQVFTNVLMAPQKDNGVKKRRSTQKTIQFKFTEPRVPKGKSIGIIGNTKGLGDWKKPLILSNKNYPEWSTSMNLDKVVFPINYKYVLVDENSKEIEIWEEGDERSIFYIDISNKSILHIQNDIHFRYANGNWKGAGVAVPVFSLRTEDSFGVGEFKDLKKMVDWSVKTGMKMIQLLPVNETIATHSWLDSYPYKAISVFALHPIYLNLDEMGSIDDEKIRDEYELARDMLNSKPYVDYVEVTQVKARFFKYIFDQNWKAVKKSAAYRKFFNENKYWLEAYAAFCFLRDRFKTSDFSQWDVWSVYNPEKIKHLVNPKSKHYEHIAIHYYIQFNLDEQLKDVVEYAHTNGVALKGDIPIGISPNSIEAWTQPELFNLNGQAGAPPDDFAVLGQNWGFPTYNWDVMANDGFKWWKNRLSAMSKYFDAYRIDHILGFFRIWEIPKDALHGLLGYFKPGLPLLLDEILDWEIYFDRERFIKPYIRGHFLHEIFGEYSDEVRQLYLDETSYNEFELKEIYNTQRKIYNHFTPTLESGQKLSEKNVIIRDGLINLLDEVLFIKDPHASVEAYHPRITMHNSYSYRELDGEIKYKLDQLYIHFFYKRHEAFWRHEAMKKLPAITNASNMLICGEDLGMIPENVPQVMKELNILSLEIQRMPKNPDIEFGHPSDAPYLSVCTTSTHDMSTIRGWWEEHRGKTQRFFHHILGQNGIAPYFAEPWVCHDIIKQHLYSPAMWTIFPIQDLLAIDGDLRWDETDKERINVPSDEKNKWRYRMILGLDEMLNASEFNSMLKSMIHQSGRDTDK